MGVKGTTLKRNTLINIVLSLPAPYYEIRCIVDSKEPGPALCRVFSKASLLTEGPIGWLACRNNGLPIFEKRRKDNIETAKYNIFFRPDDPNFIRVDDLSADAVAEMCQDGIPICCVIRTSPNCYHAWLCLARRPEKIDVQDATLVLRYLTRRYGGDVRAVGANALGRLPGYYNRKPVYAAPDGTGPLVGFSNHFGAFRIPPRYRPFSAEFLQNLLTEAEVDEIANRSITPSAARGVLSRCDIDPSRSIMTPKEADEIFEEVSEFLHQRGMRYADDRSDFEFNVAIRLLNLNFQPDDIAYLLLHASEKGFERGESYVLHTVMRAVEAHAKRRRTLVSNA